MFTPTPVGVQISEDVPLPGEVLVAEGIRVPEDIRVPEGVQVPEHFRAKTIKITRPDSTRKNVLPSHLYQFDIFYQGLSINDVIGDLNFLSKKDI